MSDCSTQAMTPKEPPRTCGTCYWMMMQPGHGECGACGNPECGLERGPEAYGNGYYLYTTVDGDCEGEFWKPRTGVPARKNGKALEQRCQHLEQVAREMYDWADGVVNRCCTVVPERVDGFRARLESLGVDLDGWNPSI